MWRWLSVTLIGMTVLMSAMVAQLVVVVAYSKGDPTLTLCSIVVGDSFATALLVFWCQYTERNLRNAYWHERLIREKNDEKGPRSKVR